MRYECSNGELVHVHLVELSAALKEQYWTIENVDYRYSTAVQIVKCVSHKRQPKGRREERKNGPGLNKRAEQFVQPSTAVAAAGKLSETQAYLERTTTATERITNY